MRAARIFVLLAVVAIVSVAVPAAAKPKKDRGPNTGPVPANCVKWDDGEIGVDSTKMAGGVAVTLSDWTMDDEGEWTGFSYSSDADVAITVKAGRNVEEAAGSPYSTFDSTNRKFRGKEISNVVACGPEDGGGGDPGGGIG